MNFVFDHDVADEVAFVLRRRGHEVVLLRTVLPITSPDAQVFAYACEEKLFLVTCNRNHFLELANEAEHPGLIVLIRRRTRQDEASRLLRLIKMLARMDYVVILILPERSPCSSSSITAIRLPLLNALIAKSSGDRVTT